MSSSWEPHAIVANGATFNYYHLPAPGKPALVLQHGFSDNGLCWAPVAEELAGSYDIYMPDARGHGRSERVARGQAIDQAADLAAVLGGLGVKKALVAGHSMGAQIAANLAARFPELTSAVVLEDPPWFLPQAGTLSGPRGTMEDSPLGKWMIAQQAMSLDEIVASCHQEHPTWPEPYVQAWCQGKKEIDLNFLVADNPMGAGWQERAAAIQCPVLLVTADPAQGGIVTSEVAAIVTQSNPKIRVVNFPGIGHHVRFAVHEPYMQAFKAFLQEI